MTRNRSRQGLALLPVITGLVAFALMGATSPGPRVSVTMLASPGPRPSGRLLIFVEPATAANADSDTVDIGDPGASDVSVAARDVTDLDALGSVTIDTSENAYPATFGGRGPSASKLVTMR